MHKPPWGSLLKRQIWTAALGTRINELELARGGVWTSMQAPQGPDMGSRAGPGAFVPSELLPFPPLLPPTAQELVSARGMKCCRRLSQGETVWGAKLTPGHLASRAHFSHYRSACPGPPRGSFQLCTHTPRQWSVGVCVYVDECVLCVSVRILGKEGSQFYIPQRFECNPTRTSGATSDLGVMGTVALDPLSASCSQEGAFISLHCLTC